MRSENEINIIKYVILFQNKQNFDFLFFRKG